MSLFFINELRLKVSEALKSVEISQFYALTSV